MLQGSCLCQSVQWSYDATLECVTACNCTACRRYGAMQAYGYAGKEISVSGDTHSYARGKKDLSFHFCPQCGCLVYWRANSDNNKGQRRIAVNVRMANHHEDVMALPIDHFDGFQKWEDLPSDGKCVRDLWS